MGDIDLSEENKIKIIIGADIVPTENSIKAFNDGDIEKLLDKSLIDFLNNGDIRIFNLESPLCDIKSPIKKCGPNLGAPTTTINGIKALRPNLLSLANNHIMDHDDIGLRETCNTLIDADIPYIGAGENKYDASKPWIITCKNIKIGVYACTEHEFSIVSENNPGANPFDPLESYDKICELNSICDYVIVLYHGGKEYYRYPSPNLQRYCRRFIDKGADLVVCQHSHCIGCKEEYNSGTIVYGQGNFLFDKVDNDFWNSSLLIYITLENGKSCIEYLPLSRKSPGTSIAKPEIAKTILSDFKCRSDQIKNSENIYKFYDEYISKERIRLIRRIDVFSNSLIFKILNKLTKGYFGNWYCTKYIDGKKGLTLQNSFECEAWRELFIRYFKTYNK